MQSDFWAEFVAALLCLGAGSLLADEKSPKPGEIREIEIASGAKMRFCWIPPGDSQLGSSRAEQEHLARELSDGSRPSWLIDESESSRGKFRNSGFWLGKYAVTQDQWQALMGTNPSFFSKAGEGKQLVMDLDAGRLPVDHVSCADCLSFLSKLNARKGAEAVFRTRGRFALTTEDEWEYACRGGLGNARPYYFGSELNGKQANCDGRTPYGTNTPGPFREHPTEVGFYEIVAPHPWGLCDMHGNIWQWCLNEPNDGGQRLCIRGGSWASEARECRAAARNFIRRDGRLIFIGFRVSFSPEHDVDSPRWATPEIVLRHPLIPSAARKRELLEAPRESVSGNRRTIAVRLARALGHLAGSPRELPPDAPTDP
jgi:formylglycine-generating enzyme required for sulfatase activity